MLGRGLTYLMENESRDYMNRSEKRQRYQNDGKRKKMDRLLNILIAIVSILIILNLISIFTDKDQNTKNDEVANTTDESSKDAKITDDTTEDRTSEEVDEETSDDETIDEPIGSDENLSSELIVAPSEDPIVDEVIVNPNWQSTPTKQTGEHVSAYTEGHIDYEEKLETFQNAVSLEPENIIVWSVKNNGSPNSSVAVLTSKDAERTDKYRVYIEWIENEGWIPVKVEKLNQLDGAY
ncbi:DUF1510 family protein [Lysinibacillus antri]|uniref:DUF1510 family protein n=2 Tax=Lysinibacillus antri TaxID=2498145 RepID=A0A432LIE6_9BACI|nr:DUF1510 family protein [Lysinibacillus antri]